MAEAATKLPVKTAKMDATPAYRGWPPLENLRRDFNQLFGDFSDRWGSPIRHSLFGPESRELTWASAPAVDIAEKDKAYEITAELPGMDEKNVEVKVANGMLIIKGEKREEKEEKKKDYYLSERRYGAFERRFQIPEGVDGDKIDATFKKGLLTVTLPKTAAAQAAEKKIAVKAD
ncbi:MAG: Hsp20/alpha crystallin family protein [Hyphomicrobium sp.]|jgi:HSP20 family protein